MPTNHATAASPHPNSVEMPANATLPVDDALGSGSEFPDRSVSSPTDSGRPVREFEAICAKHNLACGAPENLALFIRALNDNKLLAMNFWSVVARLSSGKNGPALDQQQVLAAIVRAVSGRALEPGSEIDQTGHQDQAQHHEIDQLRRMLAGEDVTLQSTPVQPGPQLSTTVPENPLPRNDPHSSVTQLHLGSAEAVPAKPEVAPHSDAVVSEQPPAARANSSSSARPRLVLQPDPSRAAQQNHLDEEPRLTPRAARNASQHIEPAGEPRISIPLSAYAEHDDAGRPARRLGFVVLTLVLLAGAAFLTMRGVSAWRQPGNTAHDAITSVTQSASAVFTRIRNSFHGASATSPAATPSDTSVNPADVAPPASSSAESAPAAPSAAQSSSSTGAKASPTPRASSSATTPHSTSPVSRTVAQAAHDDASNAAADDSARDAALVQVSSSEMHSRLISSRFPIVPDAPNANAVSGVVTLHAVITGRGTVEHAYAISGPESLRQPAIDAVSGWRYRPYLLNGSPTDVSTTIRVDFSGND